MFWLSRQCHPTHNLILVSTLNLRNSRAGMGAYTPCLLTSTAHVSGYSFIACSKLSLRSSSLHAQPILIKHPFLNSLRSHLTTHCAVFSIIGIVNVSKYPQYPPVLGFGIALICSIFAIEKVRPRLMSVHSTAACECVWMHAPAPRFVKAAMNSGVHADGLSSSGRRMYSLVVKSMTNMFSGARRSFCTPEGARKTWSAWRMEMPPPVPVT